MRFMEEKAIPEHFTLSKLVYPCQFFVCGLNYNALDYRNMTVVMKDDDKDEMK